MNPYQLAHLAGVSSPDSIESPGARWLERIYTDYLDMLEDYDGADIDDDDIYERADSIVPIYTYEVWQVFVDLAAYQEDEVELSLFEDMEKAAMAALYYIAVRLYVALDGMDREEVTA